MSDVPRGPTTEELRARVLAQLEEEAQIEARIAFSEGRTAYDPRANPPLDERRAEHLGSAP